MPRRVVPLTDVQIRNAKRRAKSYKLSDGQGLYLEVTPTGSRLWRLKYVRPNGKENKLHLGAYPEVSLADARQKRSEIRQQLAASLDPVQVRQDARRRDQETRAQTFEKVAREWHSTMLGEWQPQTAANILHRLEVDIFPEVGSDPITDIGPQKMLRALRRAEERGALEVAKRNAQNCNRIFDYAVDCGILQSNPAARVSRALKARIPGHFAAFDAKELPNFIKAFRENRACLGRITHICMDIMLRVFVRTSELIETPWREIDFDNERWVIPWQRMKRGKRRKNPSQIDHEVCASRQVWMLLRELHQLTGGGEFLFPNMRDAKRPMSNGALLKALERMGYRGDMTGHGFRSLAMSTLKEQLDYRHEVVDRQLAHAQKNKLESAYDRAMYIDERIKMMQAWSDYLDCI